MKNLNIRVGIRDTLTNYTFGLLFGFRVGTCMKCHETLKIDDLNEPIDTNSGCRCFREMLLFRSYKEEARKVSALLKQMRAEKAEKEKQRRYDEFERKLKNPLPPNPSDVFDPTNPSNHVNPLSPWFYAHGDVNSDDTMRSGTGSDSSRSSSHDISDSSSSSSSSSSGGSDSGSSD